MSRKPALRPNLGNREELLERRIAQLEDRLRQVPTRTSVVNGMWDIRGKLVSGAPWTSGSGSIEVPAGVYRILAIATAAGGAGGGGDSGDNIWWYASATSGGATNQAIQMQCYYCGGGHGAMCMAWVDVSPFESISYSIGAGVAAGNGGNTTITFPSSGGTITLEGGRAGAPADAGRGGVVTHTVASSRNPVIIDAMAAGGLGSRFYFKDSGGIVIGGWAAPTITPYNTFLIPGTTYGAGTHGSTGAGTGGALYLYH